MITTPQRALALRTCLPPTQLRTLSTKVAVCAMVITCMCAGGAQEAGAIVFGQRDTFTVPNGVLWSGGPLTGIVADGGPNAVDGVGDPYLRVISDGAGPGGKLVTHHSAGDWLGDYLTAGVTTIEMDLRNGTSQPLTMRIAIKQVSAQGSPGYCTTNDAVFMLPPDGEWHHAIFSLSIESLTRIGNSNGGLAGLLGGGIQDLRIMHANSPLLTGGTLIGEFGVDNITATPAPGAAGMLLIAVGFAARRKRAFAA